MPKPMKSPSKIWVVEFRNKRGSRWHLDQTVTPSEKLHVVAEEMLEMHEQFPECQFRTRQYVPLETGDE